MSSSLYDKYGGFATVSNLVHDFYDRIGQTPELDSYFEGVNMSRLISHQTKFLCMALGGPADYTGRQLSAAHKSLSITPAHFDLVAEILQETLEDGGVEEDDINAIMGIVGSTKEDIVAKAA